MVAALKTDAAFSMALSTLPYAGARERKKKPLSFVPHVVPLGAVTLVFHFNRVDFFSAIVSHMLLCSTHIRITPSLLSMLMFSSFQRLPHSNLLHKYISHRLSLLYKRISHFLPSTPSNTPHTHICLTSRFLSSAHVHRTNGFVEVVLALVRPSATASDRAASDEAADSEEGRDGTGPPEAELVARWLDPSTRASVCVVEIEATGAATWGRQLACAHFDLRTVKVHDIPMQGAASSASTRNYVVSVRRVAESGRRESVQRMQRRGV